jgi:Abnormal spindle-like microcephaly-assoc'd, ASPM-SPD-2-Hydin
MHIRALLIACLVVAASLMAWPANASAATSAVKVRLEGGPNFGTQAVTTSTSKTVTITNTGTTAASLGTISVTGQGFSLDFDSITCGNSLEPGTSCSYDILFTPPSAGTWTGVTDVGINNESTIIKLRGRGV